MSYDLFFHSPSTMLPSPEELREYFESRPGYSIHGAEIRYENQWTGVNFSFELEAGSSQTSVSFCINYFRPHFFALEAEPELSAFVARFAFHVVDPQQSGMGSGPYSGEGFLRGWNAGNAFAAQGILRSTRMDVPTLPAATNAAVWRWNQQISTNPNPLMPGIFLFKREGRVVTAIVLPPEPVSILVDVPLPWIDLVIRAGAPHSVFNANEVWSLLGRRSTGRSEDCAHLVVDDIELALAVDRAAQTQDALVGLQAYQVLDQELIDSVRAKQD